MADGENKECVLGGKGPSQRLADKAKREIEETREEIAELEGDLQAAAKEITVKWADRLTDIRR